MQEQYKKRLEKNIVKFAWYKIFTKRVYLPVIAVFLVTQGKVTVEEIALIAGVSTVAQILLQMPGGYFADKHGYAKAMKYSSLFITVSPLFYIFMPNVWGGLLAAIFFFGPWSFQQGSAEAFMHDTLIALDREKDYAKVVGRSQSYGLVGNLMLTATIPATYAIDPMLPFILGFFSLVAMTWLVYSFEYPVVLPSGGPKTLTNPFRALKSVITIHNVVFFVFAGFMTSISMNGGSYKELLYQDIGIATLWFGIIASTASLFGAGLGLVTESLNKLRPLSFYLFDVLIQGVCLVVAGMSREPVVVALCFIVFGGYGYIRIIIIQSKLLTNIQHVYKATLLSALGLFSHFALLATIAVFGYFISTRGYSGGHLAFGLFTLTVGLLLWSLVALVSRRKVSS